MCLSCRDEIDKHELRDITKAVDKNVSLELNTTTKLDEYKDET